MLQTWVIEFDKAQNKDKLHRHKVLHEAQTLALVGIFINLRRQAIDDFFEKKSQVLCKKEHGSIHLIISHLSIT